MHKGRLKNSILNSKNWNHIFPFIETLPCNFVTLKSSSFGKFCLIHLNGHPFTWSGCDDHFFPLFTFKNFLVIIGNRNRQICYRIRIYVIIKICKGCMLFPITICKGHIDTCLLLGWSRFQPVNRDGSVRVTSVPFKKSITPA